MNKNLIGFACWLIAFNCSAQNYSLLPSPKGIQVSNGISSIRISNAVEDTIALIYQDTVYYVHNDAHINRGQLMQYLINSKQTTTLLDSATAAEQGIVLGIIVQVVIDPERGILYGTSIQKPQMGATSYLTFSFNIQTKELKAYRDGILTDINQQGLQTSYYYDIDAKGTFRTKHVFYPDARLLQSYPKEYITEIAH
jgi:hypothetical protein